MLMGTMSPTHSVRSRHLSRRLFQAFLVLLIGGTAARASAQSHAHGPGQVMPDQQSHTGMDFAGIPDERQASGTAWQPDGTPMEGSHQMRADWQLMTHYNAFVAYESQSGPRGDDQFNSVNWLMLMATRRVDMNEFMLRGMFSLEPWTTTKRGYPLLFQSGEAYRGQPLIDRQHPHDFFMELAGRYRRALAPGTALSLYIAPAGEPALGPAAFPHRLSAMANPAAPISHHWLDSTHISFGVLSAGLTQGAWQLEGSWFNGREPDDRRWNIEEPRLDSYAARLSWNPTRAWSAQISHGYLKSPEELHPDESVRRTTASLMHLTELGDDRRLATTLGWGRNEGEQATNAFLIEPSYLAKNHTVFARAEYVEKTGEELGLTPETRKIGVTQLTLGASRDLVSDRPWRMAVGASITYSFKPRDLDAVYGDNPVGFWVFVRLHPAEMASHDQ